MTEQKLQDLQKVVETTAEALNDIKADSISVLETQDKTSLFSRMVIAGGDSSHQVRALANNMVVSPKKAGFEILNTERQDSGEQALVDADDLVAYAMLPTARNYYDIDTLWDGEKPSFYAGAQKSRHVADN